MSLLTTLVDHGVLWPPSLTDRLAVVVALRCVIGSSYSSPAPLHSSRWIYNVSTSTIATQTLRSPAGAPYCLTAGTDAQSVFASYCTSEERRGDSQQGWVVEYDATIRPLNGEWTSRLAAAAATALAAAASGGGGDDAAAAAPSLCLTTGNPDGVVPSTAVFLSVRAWHE